jgi:hypothetical protein
MVRRGQGGWQARAEDPLSALVLLRIYRFFFSVCALWGFGLRGLGTGLGSAARLRVGLRVWGRRLCFETFCLGFFNRARFFYTVFSHLTYHLGPLFR